MTTASFYEMIARDLLDRPTAVAVAWESLHMDRGDGITAVKLRMAEVPTYVRGPKKGKLNFQGCTNQATIFILPEQYEAWCAAHPEVCQSCANTRELFVRWSVDDGTTMRPCTDCEGEPWVDGRPPGAEVPGTPSDQLDLFAEATS